MIKEVKGLSIAVALIGMTCLPVLAADYAIMSADDLAGFQWFFGIRSG